MKNAYGVKGQQLLECARLFDRCYKARHDAGHLATPDEVARERATLKMAIAGVLPGWHSSWKCALVSARRFWRSVPAHRAHTSICE